MPSQPVAAPPTDTYIFVMQIGNLIIEGRVVLAPMAGVTDVVFRRICRRFGAAIVYSEFLSSDGLVLRHMNQAHKLALADDEHPVAYQLFGARTDTFRLAAPPLVANGADLLDLNFGCPVKKVVKGHAGAAILKDLDLLESIVRAVVESVEVPVTVKMRAGWDSENLVYREAAERAVAAGAAAVTLHARTRSDGPWSTEYNGRARWEYITDLKRHLSAVPVIGNGDVNSPEAARRMLEETGCDAVMVGRAAMGCPWVFAEMNHFLDTGRMLPPPNVADRLALAFHHLREKVASFTDERPAVLHMRRQLSSYFKGLPGKSRLRGKLMMLDSVAEVETLFAEYLEENPDLPRAEGDGWLSDYISFDRDWLPDHAREAVS